MDDATMKSPRSYEVVVKVEVEVSLLLNATDNSQAEVKARDFIHDEIDIKLPGTSWNIEEIRIAEMMMWEDGA